MWRNDEIKQLREDLDILSREMDSLSKSLINGQVITESREMDFESCRLFSQFYATRKFNNLDTKLNLILDHLKLESKWIDCRSHYELKEKKEDK